MCSQAGALFRVRAIISAGRYIYRASFHFFPRPSLYDNKRLRNIALLGILVRRLFGTSHGLSCNYERHRDRLRTFFLYEIEPAQTLDPRFFATTFGLPRGLWEPLVHHAQSILALDLSPLCGRLMVCRFFLSVGIQQAGFVANGVALAPLACQKTDD
jgi:hypothetical protein